MLYKLSSLGLQDVRDSHTCGWFNLFSDAEYALGSLEGLSVIRYHDGGCLGERNDPLGARMIAKI